MCADSWSFAWGAVWSDFPPVLEHEIHVCDDCRAGCKLLYLFLLPVFKTSLGNNRLPVIPGDQSGAVVRTRGELYTPERYTQSGS